MNIPDGKTEEEVIEVIQKVCNRSAPKYTFYGYTSDDIKQESFIICLEALERYDPKYPLENFLAVNLVNRLKNFVRDNYVTANTNQQKVKIFQPAQLNNANSIQNWFEIQSMFIDDIDKQEMLDIIDRNLPARMRLDYLKITNNVYVPKSRTTEILEEIQNILEEYGYYEEG
jgi:DNA-directed RNA polymerase specialized sigma24 family protein